jgi:hypothetical protein
MVPTTHAVNVTAPSEQSAAKVVQVEAPRLTGPRRERILENADWKSLWYRGLCSTLRAGCATQEDGGSNGELDRKLL